MTSFVFIILLYIVRIISAMQLLHLRFSITTQIAISIETFFEFSGFFLGASRFAVRCLIGQLGSICRFVVNRSTLLLIMISLLRDTTVKLNHAW